MALFRKPTRRIIIAGSFSGAVSAISVLIGIPIDKDDISALFLKAACITIGGAYEEKCLAWALLLSFIAFAVGLIILVNDIRKVGRFWRIPGWAMGLMLYSVCYVIAQALMLGYFA
jgi:hypothetical protein